MGVKPDRWIEQMCREHRMIEPYEPRLMREGVISYGVSSYGYDIRIADEFKIFTNVNSTVVDPKRFDPRSLVDFKGDVCVIPPNSFASADGGVLPHPARRALHLRGQVVLRALRHHHQRDAVRARVGGFRHPGDLEHTPLPARIYANEGIAQLIFFAADGECETSYADRKGKYQAQTGITLPKL